MFGWSSMQSFVLLGIDNDDDEFDYEANCTQSTQTDKPATKSIGVQMYMPPTVSLAVQTSAHSTLLFSEEYLENNMQCMKFYTG